MYARTRSDVIKPGKIHRGWKNAGVRPFDPELILKLQAKTPPPECIIKDDSGTPLVVLGPDTLDFFRKYGIELGPPLYARVAKINHKGEIIEERDASGRLIGPLRRSTRRKSRGDENKENESDPSAGDSNPPKKRKGMKGK